MYLRRGCCETLRGHHLMTYRRGLLSMWHAMALRCGGKVSLGEASLLLLLLLVIDLCSSWGMTCLAIGVGWSIGSRLSKTLLVLGRRVW